MTTCMLYSTSIDTTTKPLLQEITGGEERGIREKKGGDSTVKAKSAFSRIKRKDVKGGTIIL